MPTCWARKKKSRASRPSEFRFQITASALLLILLCLLSNLYTYATPSTSAVLARVLLALCTCSHAMPGAGPKSRGPNCGSYPPGAFALIALLPVASSTQCLVGLGSGLGLSLGLGSELSRQGWGWR